jgi:hypothetical protein
MCARRRSNFLLLRQKKVTKEKATHSLLPLRCAAGQTCVGALAGCAVELTALLRSSVRTTPASQWTKHARCDAHAHPTSAPPQAQPEGGGKEHGPSLRSAWRARRAAPAPLGAERSDGPWGSWAAALPSGCAEERSGQRIRARDCLSAAGASSSETPLAASTAGCPQRSGGTRPAGSPFLCLLSFGEAKESESPAGAKPGQQLTQQAQHSLRQKASHQALQMRPQRLQVHKAQVIHRR